MTNHSPSNLSDKNIFQSMHINPHEDTFEVQVEKGFISVVLKKSNGQVTTVNTTTDNAFSVETNYNNTTCSIERRRECEARLHSEGFSQVRIAKIFGLTQPTVSRDLKINRQRQKAK